MRSTKMKHRQGDTVQFCDRMHNDQILIGKVYCIHDFETYDIIEENQGEMGFNIHYYVHYNDILGDRNEG